MMRRLLLSIVCLLGLVVGCGKNSNPSGDPRPVRVAIDVPTALMAASAAAKPSPSAASTTSIPEPEPSGSRAAPYPLEILPGDTRSLVGTAEPASGDIMHVRYEVRSPTGAAVQDGSGWGVVTVRDGKSARWMLPTLPLLPGLNQVIVTATDTSGRSGWSSVWVTMPSVYVAIELVSGAVYRATRFESLPPTWVTMDSVVILVRIPGGRYELGADSTSTVGYDPLIDAQREVIVDPFYIALDELTQYQWSLLTGGAAPATEARNLPVTDVSRADAAGVLAAYAAARRLPVRLPLDSEWEIAARADAPVGSAYHYPPQADVAEWVYAWDTNAQPSAVTAIRTRMRNGWGFWDMHGNAMEITQTTVRDGSWSDNLVHARHTAWFTTPDEALHPLIGLRMGMSPE